MVQPSHWQANNIREVRYKRKAPRALERSTIIGQRGAKYSVIGVSVIEPTLEYPDVAVSFALSNGASYAYSQIKVEEFGNLIQTLQEWHTLIMGIMPELEAKAAIIAEQRRAYDEQMSKVEEMQAQIRMMQQAAGQMEGQP